MSSECDPTTTRNRIAFVVGLLVAGIILLFADNVDNKAGKHNSSNTAIISETRLEK